MTTYIARFRAVHETIQIVQHSCFTWQQESGEVDTELLSGKILRESSVHFYKMLGGKQHPVSITDINIEILAAERFNG